MNSCTKNGHLKTVVSYDAVRRMNRADFSISIKEGSPITSQKSTGRCWLFAALNVLRIPFQQKLGIKDFEFSQAFLFFYDKFERVNYVLTQIIDTCDLPRDDRLIACLLNNPCEDGGQFDMIKNIVKKYGLVPKSAFPDVACCDNSRKLKRLGNSKVREWAMLLRNAAKNDASSEELSAMRKGFMKEWWKILCIHVGTPPDTFDFCFTDKDQKYHCWRDNTPLSFLEQIKSQCSNEVLLDHISLIHDPRNPYNKPYTVDRLNNMSESEPILYINIEMDMMKGLAVDALDKGEPVWFGCDFGPFNHRELGILDQGIFDYGAMFDVEFGQDKASRLHYYESCMTHAMVLTGVDLSSDGLPLRWRVENSHGKDRGLNGYFTMSDRWFSEYVFQIALPKSYLPKEILNAMTEESTVFPRWDPMGTLAK